MTPTSVTCVQGVHTRRESFGGWLHTAVPYYSHGNCGIVRLTIVRLLEETPLQGEVTLQKIQRHVSLCNVHDASMCAVTYCAGKKCKQRVQGWWSLTQQYVVDLHYRAQQQQQQHCTHLVPV
jgi:hypothetical protein